MASTNFKNLTRQLYSSRIKYSYAALCEIRKKYMKDVTSLIKAGLVSRVLELIRTRDNIEEQYRSKVMMISLSILGNLCMESLTRKEVLKHRGIQSIVELYKETECVELLTRICRTLSNMMLDPCSWELVCCVSVTEKTVKTLKDTDDKDVQLTFIRAIRLLGSTDSHVQKLLSSNAVSVVFKYIDSDQQEVKDAVLRCIYSLSSRRCCGNFASQVITSRQLSHLMDLLKLKDNQTFDLISRLCEYHHFRAEFGNLGGIDILNDFITTESGLDDKRIFDSISILCQCCKEAVNRLKLREKSILPLLMRFLSDGNYACLHCRIISALVSFLYDEEGFNILLENELVPVLIKCLKNCIGYNENDTKNKNRSEIIDDSKNRSEEVNDSKNRPEEMNDSKNRPEEVNDSKNRPEEVINLSEENFINEMVKEPVEIRKPKIVVVKVGNEIIDDTDKQIDTQDDSSVIDIKSKIKINRRQDEIEMECDAEAVNKQTDGMILEKLEKGPSRDKIEMTSDGDTTKSDNTINTSTNDMMDKKLETVSSNTKPIYSPHSPTYQTCSDWNYNDDNDVTCISRFTPPPMGNTGYSYSPLSVTSYDSPVGGSPGSRSSPGTSPNAHESGQYSSKFNGPKYSSVVCQLYNVGPSSRDGAISHRHYDSVSMVTGNYSPGGKSPSPSQMSDLSDVNYKYTYSPVNTDSEDDLDDEVNDIEDNELDDMPIGKVKLEEDDKMVGKNDILAGENDKLAGKSDKLMGKSDKLAGNFDMLKTDGRIGFVDDGRTSIENSSSGKDSEMTDQCERNVENMNLDFSEVFHELDKIENEKKKGTYKKIDSEKDKVTEYNILTLLSRVSQMTDPTMHLVTSDVFVCLLDYMRSVSMPLARCPRLMSRVVRNPICFQTLLFLNIPVLIYDKLLRYENLDLVVSNFIKDQTGNTRNISKETTDDTVEPAAKRRKTSDGHVVVFKGIDHKQEVDCCETGSSAMTLLEDFSSIVDSHYGRGTVENSLFNCNDEQRKKLCCCLLYITWSSESRQNFFNQKCIIDCFTLSIIRQNINKINGQGHSVV